MGLGSRDKSRLFPLRFASHRNYLIFQGLNFESASELGQKRTFFKALFNLIDRFIQPLYSEILIFLDSSCPLPEGIYSQPKRKLLYKKRKITLRKRRNHGAQKNSFNRR